MIDLHSATLTLNGETLRIKSGSVRADESWSPYVQADIVCPLPANIEAVDPRDDVRALVTLRRDFGTPFTNAQFTAAHATPTTGAALTAAYAGMTNAQITARFFEPYGASIRAPQVAEFNLAVRARRVNHVTQELSLTLASDEKRLQDYALLQTVPYTNFTTSLRALVGDILSRVGGSLEPGDFDAVIAEAGTSWTPGATAWDYLSPHIEKADGRLWCDASRRWHLGPRESLEPGQLTLTTGANGTLTRAEDTIDRSGEAWADAVVVAYKWTDAAGAQQAAYDVAGDPATARKVMTLTREQPFPGAGAAAAILKRSEDRGRVLALTAVSDYTAQPGQAFMATLPGTPALTGIVSAIAWDLTGFEMTVDTRGLLDTPATAWSFQPAGRTWNDVPTGTDWTEV